MRRPLPRQYAISPADPKQSPPWPGTISRPGIPSGRNNKRRTLRPLSRRLSIAAAGQPAITSSSLWTVLGGAQPRRMKRRQQLHRCWSFNIALPARRPPQQPPQHPPQHPLPRRRQPHSAVRLPITLTTQTALRQALLVATAACPGPATGQTLGRFLSRPLRIGARVVIVCGCTATAGMPSAPGAPI